MGPTEAQHPRRCPAGRETFFFHPPPSRKQPLLHLSSQSCTLLRKPSATDCGKQQQGPLVLPCNCVCNVCCCTAVRLHVNPPHLQFIQQGKTLRPRQAPGGTPPPARPYLLLPRAEAVRVHVCKVLQRGPVLAVALAHFATTTPPWT